MTVAERNALPERVSVSASNAASNATTEPPSRASPEPPVTDLQGHYLGPSSGVSFLHRVQQRLRLGDHASPSFIFGDTPLPDFDPMTFCVMVSKEETSLLVQKYFNFSVPIDRFFHRPTIEAWLEEFHDTMGAMADTNEAPARRAVLWTIFATAQKHFSDLQAENDNKSIAYFQMAEYHLSKEKEATCLASVQARLFQCFWLLSQSRINHCWELFGAATRLAIAMGLHRKKCANLGNDRSWIEQQCRRRTFWSAYCLDCYLSMALGRPRVFHEEDIDQELCSDLDDSNFTRYDLNPPPSSNGFSPMLAPVAYYKLHRIINVVLRDLYSIHPASTAKRCALALEYSERLKAWRAEVPKFVDEDNQAPLIALYQRQRDVLNLMHWHAIILVHRPLLLTNITRSSRSGDQANDTTPHDAQMNDSVEECLRASMRIVTTVTKLIDTGRMYRSFWGTTYVAFSATVLLYVYTIHQLVSSTNTYQEYFDAAVRCQEQLSKLAVKGSLAARYYVVLEELRTESVKQMERWMRAVDNDTVIDGNSVPNQNLDGSLGEVAYDDLGGAGDSLHLYESSLADISNWAQFESLIVPGFGGFDPTFRDI
ncbi:fungal-specific transcription factor domain-containing protein [Xylariales sp. PMI_506]|nr:fungal-specific transcription factor domain-containing protein [Xylariales sp. PMI_506]